VYAGSGLLTWEAVRRAPEGGVYALASATTDGEALRQQAARLPELERPFILIGDLTELDTLLTLRGEVDLLFDRILARNLITQLRNYSISKLFTPLKNRLAIDGRFCLVQTIPKHGQRLYELVDWSNETKVLAKKVAQAEEKIYADEADPLVNWDETDLQTGLKAAGFKIVSTQVDRERGQRRLTTSHLDRWFNPSGDLSPGTYGQRLLEDGLSPKDVEKVSTLYRQQLAEQVVSWETAIVYLVVISSS
jgi:putative ATPase